MRGLQKMIDNEDYCMTSSRSRSRSRSPLGSLNKLLVENHLRTPRDRHVRGGGEQKDLAVAEPSTYSNSPNNRGGK